MKPGLSLAERLLVLPQDARAEFLQHCSPDEIALIEADLEHLRPTGDYVPLEHQKVDLDAPYRGYLFTGGRGAGKSQSLSYNAVKHMKGPACDSRVPGGHRVLAVSPTGADAVSVLHSGPSGITALWPGTRLTQGVEGTHLKTPSGVAIRLIGAFTLEDVERARAAGNSCLVLCDELATWRREEIWDNILFGLRLGRDPKWIAATTPKNRGLYKMLAADGNVFQVHATFRDNPYLPQVIKDELEKKYAGTRIGRQELEGELIEEVEGALWSLEMIELAKMNEQSGQIGRLQPPIDLRRTSVFVDPSGSAHGDLTGIIVIGQEHPGEDGARARLWVLADRSTDGTPKRRFEAVCRAAGDFSAGEIVFESQFSGDNYGFGVERAWETLRRRGSVEGPCPRVRGVPARGSKGDRARLAVMSYERIEVKHVDGLERLEEEQTTWTEDETWSPNRMDALVHGVNQLEGRGRPLRAVPAPDFSRGDDGGVSRILGPQVVDLSRVGITRQIR